MVNSDYLFFFFLYHCWSRVIDCNGLLGFFYPRVGFLSVFFTWLLVCWLGCYWFWFCFFFYLKKKKNGWLLGALGVSMAEGSIVELLYMAGFRIGAVGCGRLQQRLHTTIWDATAAICSAIWGSMRQGCGIPFSRSGGSCFVTAAITCKLSAPCWQGQVRAACSAPKGLPDFLIQQLGLRERTP